MRLYKVLPSFALMAPLAALEFCLSGVGLIAVANHWLVTAQIFGVATGVLGCITTLQYLFPLYRGRV